MAVRRLWLAQPSKNLAAISGGQIFRRLVEAPTAHQNILLREKMVRTHVPKKQPIFNTSILTDFVRSLGTLHPGKINAQAVGENGFFTPIFRRR